MPLPNLLHIPGFVRWGVRLDTAPAGWWIAAQCAALWPTWRWMGQRLADGSDDPLGVLALGALGVLLWTTRQALRAAPLLPWLALALLGTVAATAAASALPPLLAGVVAMLALACTLRAFLPARVATLPVAGLAVLALPLLSSLQFYAGYPLRVLTAEASGWLLSLGYVVQREGSTLLVAGRLVIVDAPCSGVQMAWLGYFTACTVALWAGLPNKNFMARLPLVSMLVLAGNILRNSVLVAGEASGRPLGPLAHEAFGLLCLAMVCGGIAWAMSRPAPATAGTATR